MHNPIIKKDRYVSEPEQIILQQLLKSRDRRRKYLEI
jgi:hypothetical protein